jgi:hypothetical protein
MKVVFVNTDIGHDTCLHGLTLNKTYEVVDVYTFFSIELGHPVTLYSIKMDKGTTGDRNARLFITLEEFRNKQIEKILI